MPERAFRQETDIAKLQAFLAEPVGTVESHRGQGLAAAVLAETLMNLHRYGAEMVYVRTAKANEPAVRLYQKLGFVITNEDHGWERLVKE